MNSGLGSYIVCRTQIKDHNNFMKFQLLGNAPCSWLWVKKRLQKPRSTNQTHHKDRYEPKRQNNPSSPELLLHWTHLTPELSHGYWSFVYLAYSTDTKKCNYIFFHWGIWISANKNIHGQLLQPSEYEFALWLYSDLITTLIFWSLAQKIFRLAW